MVITPSPRPFTVVCMTLLKPACGKAKKVTGVVKLALGAGKATPAPPVGPALGAKGVNIMVFCKDYNARTADKHGYIIPVEITVYDDRSFTFILKTAPTSVLLLKAAGVEKGSKDPKLEKVGKRYDMANTNGMIFAEGHSSNRPPLFNGNHYTYWKNRMRIWVTETIDQLRAIATEKLLDLNCSSMESAMSIIAGTAANMGIDVDPPVLEPKKK